MKKLTGPILLIGTADSCEDFVYNCGFRAPDPAVLLVGNNGRCLVVPRLEFARAVRSSSCDEVLTPEMLGLPAQDRKHVEKWAVALLRRRRIRQVAVPASFPMGAGRWLEQNGVRIEVTDTTLFPARAVKSAREIKNIRTAQQAAVIAMRAAITMIASADADGGHLRLNGKPLTSEDVKRRISAVMLQRDCFGRDTIVAGGEQGADPHEQGHGELRTGEAIVVDIFPQHGGNGYWGDLTRTVVRGAPAPGLARMYGAVKAAQTAALSRIRPGVKCRTVHKAAVAEFRKRGFERKMGEEGPEGFIHSTGHGVGLAIHEEPAITESDRRLRSGNVITIEPGLYYRGLGGVRIEDTIVVTTTGWRYLVPCEKRFQV